MTKSSAAAAPAGVRFSPFMVVLTASALAWGLLFYLVPPLQQNFPLNDDWAFAWGALRFSRGEGIHYGGWASMPQLGQWLWACPFVWLLGESHVSLRIATLVLSWLGLWALYDLLRQHGSSGPHAALACAALAFNPLFFLLQGTFMTDVPALSLALGSLALYARGLRGGDRRWLLAGCGVAILAAITRQNTLAVSGAAALLLVWQREQRRKPIAWVALLMPVAAGVACHLWLQARNDVRAMEPALISPFQMLFLTFVVVHLSGLAALPLLVGESLQMVAVAWKQFMAILALLALYALGICAAAGTTFKNYLPYGCLFPYTENMLTPHGAFAGSSLVGNLLVGEGARPLVLPNSVRVALTGLGCLAGAALIVSAWQGGRESLRRPLLLFTLLQVPFLLVTIDFYDRYLLFFLPGALALACSPGRALSTLRSMRLLLSLPVLVLFAGIAFGLMRDWLAWNAARWELGRRALQHHIDPLEIEGGVEWNGWYTMEVTARSRIGPRRWPVLAFTRDWFPAIEGRYELSFAPLPGTRTLDQEPYTLWLPPGKHTFYLLEAALLPRARVEQPAQEGPSAKPGS